MSIKKTGFQFDIVDLILLLCCLFTCMTGHEHTGTVLSVGRYAVFACLLFAVGWKGVSIDWGILVFCILNVCAGVFAAVYHTFGGSRFFLLYPSLTAVLYYCLYAYCGYYIARKRWDSELLFWWIHRISVAAGIVIIAQYVCFWQGISLHKIPVIGDYLFHAVDTAKYFRPSAFFSEPSYLAEIVLLDLFSNLFRKKNLRMAGLNLLSLALSTSGLGIVFGYGLFVWWAVSQKLVRNKLLNVLIKLLLLTLLISILLAVLGYSGNNAILNRILGGSTIRQRTLRAFEIYSKLQPAEKVFGIGMQNLTSYLNTHHLNLVNEGIDTLENKEFAQSFGYIICSLGVLGGASFLLHIVVLLKKMDKKYWGLLILFVAMSVTASLITRLIFVLYIAAMWTVAFESQVKEYNGYSTDVSGQGE